MDAALWLCRGSVRPPPGLPSPAAIYSPTSPPSVPTAKCLPKLLCVVCELSWPAHPFSFTRCTDPQEAGHRWRRHVHPAVPASSMAKLSSLKQVPAERPLFSALLPSESSPRNTCVYTFTSFLLRPVLTTRLILPATKCVENTLYRTLSPC